MKTKINLQMRPNTTAAGNGLNSRSCSGTPRIQLKNQFMVSCIEDRYLPMVLDLCKNVFECVTNY